MFSAAFDLDGVLVDTREVVEEAYHRAGVDMPWTAWGKPVHMWLPQLVGNDWSHVHELKNKYYMDMLDEVPELPAAEVARQLCLSSDWNVYVVTSASNEAMTQLLNKIRVMPKHFAGGVGPLARAAFLKWVSPFGGIYFDDGEFMPPDSWHKFTIADDTTTNDIRLEITRWMQ